MNRLIALAAASIAATALAQTAPSSSKPEQGFFRPSDLASPPPRLVVTEPSRAARAAAVSAPVQQPDAIEEIRLATELRLAEERQMDRLERENERARMQPAAPIAGAFTGLTDERSR